MNYIKKKLKERKISQTELGKRMGVGKSYISQIVNNEKKIMNLSLEKISDLTTILNISIDELVNGLEQENIIKRRHNMQETTGGKSYNVTWSSNKIISQGWQCPVCQRVMSPYISYCIFCNGNSSIEYLKNNQGTFV